MLVQRLLQLTKDSLIYGLGSALTGFIGIFLVPILTRVLVPEEYGVIDLLATVVYLANVLFSLGFDSATAILFFDRSDEKERKTILSTGLWFVLGISLLVVLFLLPFADRLANLIFQSAQYAQAFRYTLAAIPFMLTLGFALSSLRYRFLRFRYLASVGTNVISTILLTILFLVPLRLGVDGYFLAFLCTGVVSAIVAVLLARRNFSFRISKTVLKQLLTIGLPLVPAGLAGWALALIDRFFLTAYSLEELGWYSLGVKLASVLGLGIAALQLAWGPFALSLVREPEAKTTYAKVLTLFTIAAGAAALALGLFAPEIVALTSGKDFSPAARVVGILSLGLVGYGSYFIVSIGVNVVKKTAHISWTTAIAALINIGLNFLLIPHYGMVGAAMATLISYIVSAWLLFFVGQRVYPIPFESKKVLLTWGALLVCTMFTLALPTTISFSLILVKVFILFLFVFFIFFFGIIHKQEFLKFKVRLLLLLRTIRNRG